MRRCPRGIARKSGVGWIWRRHAEALFRVSLKDLRSSGTSLDADHNRLKILVKWPFVQLGRLFGRQDRNRDRILLDATDLQHERACRKLILHGLADAVAIGGTAKTLGFDEVSVLNHVDPG